MEELARNLKLDVTPYSPEIDPTYTLRQHNNDDNKNKRIIDWTIPG